MSPLATILLLILVASAAAILLYVFATGMVGGVGFGGEGGLPALRVEAVTTLEAGGIIVGFKTYVRNIGSVTINPTQVTAYIGFDSSSQKAVIVTTSRPTPPNGLLVANIYPPQLLKPATYTLRVLVDSAEARHSLVVNRETGKATKVEATANNTQENPVVVEDDYAVYTVWVVNNSGLYTVEFRVYAKPGVVIEVAYAELFNATGQHPEWVGGNPWTWTTPYTYPDYAGAYWTPVKPEEMPVTIVFVVKPSNS